MENPKLEKWIQEIEAQMEAVMIEIEEKNRLEEEPYRGEPEIIVHTSEFTLRLLKNIGIIL